MNLIQSTILTNLPTGQKKTPSGWISFNAPCCVHNGETADKKKRGGIMNSSDGTVTYHCFNCGYKANYTPGRKINYRMRMLLSYLHIPDETIRKLALQALREEGTGNTYTKKEFTFFDLKPLPKNTQPLGSWLEKYLGEDLTPQQHSKIDALIKYLQDRGIGADWYPFMYSPDKSWDMHQRVLIPFYWRNKIVGFTARQFEETRFSKVKYYTDVQPGYVFNVDAQDWQRKFVIVTEGPFDAIAVSGVSILGSEINDTQRELIQELNRQVIVVPDRDAPGQKLIDQAIEFGWSVAFPNWDKTVGDVAEAVLKYGRLFTIQSILKSTETTKLKIELKRKMYG